MFSKKIDWIEQMTDCYTQIKSSIWFDDFHENYTFLTLQKVNGGKSCYEKVSLDIYRNVNKRKQIISTIATLKKYYKNSNWILSFGKILADSNFQYINKLPN